MIADKIKKLRERNKLSQVGLAKALHVSRSTVNAWELSISQPTIKYIIEMCNVFNVTSDFILGLDDTKSISLNGLSPSQIQAVMQIIECFKNK